MASASSSATGMLRSYPNRPTAPKITPTGTVTVNTFWRNRGPNSTGRRTTNVSIPAGASA